MALRRVPRAQPPVSGEANFSMRMSLQAMAARAVHEADSGAPEILEVMLNGGGRQEGQLEGENSSATSLASSVSHALGIC